MKNLVFLIMTFFLIVAVYCGLPGFSQISPEHHATHTSAEHSSFQTIRATVEEGETFFDIFKKHNISVKDLLGMREAAADVHRLRNICPGQPYTITLDDDQCVRSLLYWIDDEKYLRVDRDDGGFQAQKHKIPYERRTIYLAGSIKDNLISSIGNDREHHTLALKISDIFAWDIDFSSDVKAGDTYAVGVEGLYVDGLFKKYGAVLYANFVNNNKEYVAHRFEWDGTADYFDAEGRSLKKSFLKAPLSFRRISSSFSKRRFHPVLRTYRPHHGVDYAAPRGTPVSATCDGAITFAGRKGQYGNLVIINHRNGYATRYGHLSRIAPNVRKSTKVMQGDVIGYVGSTGLATGPHLHYEMRLRDKYVNPLAVRNLKGQRIPPHLMAEFKKVSEKRASMSAAASVSKRTFSGNASDGIPTGS